MDDDWNNRWYLTVEVAARHHTGRTFTPEDLDALETKAHRLVSADNAVAPYPVEIMALVDSMLTLIEHRRAGTVSPIEVAGLYWFLDGAVAWRNAKYGASPDVDQGIAEWYDLLASVAADLLAKLGEGASISIRRTAQYLGKSEGHVRRMIRDGRLDATGPERNRRIPLREVQRILGSTFGP